MTPDQEEACVCVLDLGAYRMCGHRKRHAPDPRKEGTILIKGLEGNGGLGSVGSLLRGMEPFASPVSIQPRVGMETMTASPEPPWQLALNTLLTLTAKRARIGWATAREREGCPHS